MLQVYWINQRNGERKQLRCSNHCLTMWFQKRCKRAHNILSDIVCSILFSCTILPINTINNPTTDADLKPLMMSMYLLGMLRVPGPLTIHHLTIWFTVCEAWVKTGGKSNFISKEPKMLFTALYLRFVSCIIVSIKLMQSIPTSLQLILPSFKVQWFRKCWNFSCFSGGIYLLVV